MFSIFSLSGNTYTHERKGADIEIYTTKQVVKPKMLGPEEKPNMDPDIKGEFIAVKEDSLLLINRDSGADIDGPHTVIANYIGHISQTEREALIALYNSTNGDSWTDNSGWKDPPLHTDGFAMPGTEADWYGVWLSNGHVTNIELSDNNLTGSIPAEIQGLDHLIRISLSHNLLIRDIPEEIRNIPTLLFLDLNHNAISSLIPPQLANCTQLQEIRLNNNNLHAWIPAELGTLSNLNLLDLSANWLIGGIPPELGNLSGLEYLDLHWNYLSETIPPELGNLSSSFSYLNLAGNALEGNIPAELAKVTSLDFLNLRANKLIGDMPSALADLVKLTTLDIGYNCLYANDETLMAFLDLKDPDWKETQTVAPTDVSASAVSSSSINLTWTPILFTDYLGGYRIFSSETSGGPWTWIGGTEKTESEYLVTNLLANTTYYIVIQTCTGEGGPNQNELLSEYSEEVFAATYGACVAPSITQHPQNQTIGYNTSATLEVSAAGTGPFEYQWYRASSVDTTYPVGLDSNSFTTPNLVVTTSYWVRVSNACGHADSETATITVLPQTVTASIILNPSDFNQYQDDNDYAYDEDYLFCRPGSSGRLFYAPVNHPQDARITSVIAFYMDNDASGAVEVIMYKRNIYTRDYIEMCYHMSSGASSSIQKYKMAPIISNKIDNGGYIYNVRVHFTNPSENTRLYRVKIIYKIN